MLISASGGDIDEEDVEANEEFPEDEFPEVEFPDEDKCPEDIFKPCPELFTGDVITGVEKFAALAAAAMAERLCGPKWAAKYGAKVCACVILNC